MPSSDVLSFCFGLRPNFSSRRQKCHARGQVTSKQSDQDPVTSNGAMSCGDVLFVCMQMQVHMHDAIAVPAAA